MLSTKRVVVDVERPEHVAAGLHREDVLDHVSALDCPETLLQSPRAAGGTSGSRGAAPRPSRAAPRTGPRSSCARASVTWCCWIEPNSVEAWARMAPKQVLRLLGQHARRPGCTSACPSCRRTRSWCTCPLAGRRAGTVVLGEVLLPVLEQEVVVREGSARASAPTASWKVFGRVRGVVAHLALSCLTIGSSNLA